MGSNRKASVRSNKRKQQCGQIKNILPHWKYLTIKDTVESWDVILLMKLMQAVTMKDIVKFWDVILLMKLMQAVTMKV